MHPESGNAETYETLSLSFSRPGLTEFSAADISALFSVLERLYDMIAEELGYPPHFLYVTQIKHPNSAISLKGLGEPIRALKEVLAATPNIIAKFWTLPSKIRVMWKQNEAKIAEADRDIAKKKAEVQRITEASKSVAQEQAVRNAELELELAKKRLELAQVQEELLAHRFRYDENMFRRIAEAIAGMREWAPDQRAAILAEAIRYRMGGELTAIGEPLVLSVVP
jgi:hypothetical protein